MIEYIIVLWYIINFDFEYDFNFWIFGKILLFIDIINLFQKTIFKIIIRLHVFNVINPFYIWQKYLLLMSYILTLWDTIIMSRAIVIWSNFGIFWTKFENICVGLSAQKSMCGSKTKPIFKDQFLVKWKRVLKYI